MAAAEHVYVCLAWAAVLIVGAGGVQGLRNERDILLEWKQQLKDPSNALVSWVGVSDDHGHCNWTGVTCDNATLKVSTISLEAKSLMGRLSPRLCELDGLQELLLDFNNFVGPLPPCISNWTRLTLLNLTTNAFSGNLPNFSGLNSLQIVDLTTNKFTGRLPATFGNIPALVSLNLAENPFDAGPIPAEYGSLTNLETLFLAQCNLMGELPAFVFNFTKLGLLDVSENRLTGSIPPALGNLLELYQLELFGNLFSGSLPAELGNLTRLSDFDASDNVLRGAIPPEIRNLKRLVAIHLYNNRLSGTIPDGVAELPLLEALTLYNNSLTGPLPAALGGNSPFNTLDVADNRLSGALPADICKNGQLQYLIVLDNQLSGSIPESYAACKSLLRFRVNNNELSGDVPAGFWSLPNANIVDLSFNRFTGPISSGIGSSRNLTQLIINDNLFSGPLPDGITALAALVKIQAEDNQFIGPLPMEFGRLRNLNVLFLQGNNLSGPIPESIGECASLAVMNLAGNKLMGQIPTSLALIQVLNYLNLSHNQLSGSIPSSLAGLSLSLLDVSYNRLSGAIPPSLLSVGRSSAFAGNPGLCAQSSINSSEIRICPVQATTAKQDSKKYKMTAGLVVAAAVLILVSGLILFRRYVQSKKRETAVEGSESCSAWKATFFHSVDFDPEDIIQGVLKAENVIGSGASGNVYRVALRGGVGGCGGGREEVAVKSLWNTKAEDDKNEGNRKHRKGGSPLLREYEHKMAKAEVETLGKVRHKNIVKLYCHMSNRQMNLLVYEFMANGNLLDALQANLLNWPQRHRVVLGAAHGLAYLHHDCLPVIVHRDVKSTNILLDDLLHAKIADFGVAKVLQGGGDSSLVFTGTHGYIAPEHAYSLRITEKSDVYSYGVVLLEVVTGRRAVEAEFGENRDIVAWATDRICAEGDAAAVLDQRIIGTNGGSGSGSPFKEEMLHVLRVAMCCTRKLPALRPTMREVVKMLVDADPCGSFRNASALTSKPKPKPKH